MSTNRTGAGAAVNPDRLGFFYAVAVAVGVVFLASAVISFNGLYAVGLEQGLHPDLAWVTPIMLDVAILVFTMASLIQRRRGNRGQRIFAVISVAWVTLTSMGLNFLHSYYAVGIDTPMQIAATFVNTFAPASIFVTTELLVGLVIKPPPAPREPRARAAAKPKARKKPSAAKPKAAASSTYEPATVRDRADAPLPSPVQQRPTGVRLPPATAPARPGQPVGVGR